METGPQQVVQTSTLSPDSLPLSLTMGAVDEETSCAAAGLCSLLEDKRKEAPQTPAGQSNLGRRSRRSIDPKSWPMEALRARWETYHGRMKDCRRDPSEESVHELRVSIRRLLSQVVVLSSVVPGCQPEKVRRVLKEQLQALGWLRDTHVVRVFLEEQLARFPELYPVRELLGARERELIKRVSREIDEFDTIKIDKWITRLLASLEAKQRAGSGRAELITGALRQAQKQFNETAQRYQLINFSETATIHRTRVAFKKFRYVVECLPAEVTGVTPQDLRRLALYQRRMGKIQDLEVVQASVTKLTQERSGLADLLTRFTAYLRSRRNRALRSFRLSGDQLLAFWPPPALLEEAETLARSRAA